MDDDDALILGAISMLLTQVRTARRALEEVERSTSRYLGFEFARALTEGPQFGAPPMFQGALKVHVVNINDLAPGNTFGDFLMGVLGGIGNLVGGVIGGVVSGTLSVFALPVMIAQMERITANIRAILDRLGVSRRPPAAPAPAAGAAPAPAPPPTSETLLTTVEGIGSLVRNLTALFQAGAAGPGNAAGANAAGRTAPEVLTNSGERWMAILDGVNRLLDRIQHIVDGLIILIPMVIGAIALLIANLAEIRRALLETIQFILRNVLVLRGVLLTTIFETVASAARLAASIVAVLGTAIQSVLGSIVGIITTIVDAAFNALETLTTALQATIRLLLQWLVNGVFNTLREIGNLSVFRTIDHFVRILPAILEPVYRIVVAFRAGSSDTFDPALRNQLSRAFEAGFAGGASGPAGTLPGGAITGTGTTATTEQIIGEFPPVGDILRPLGATLSAAVNATGAQLTDATRGTFDTIGETLGRLAGDFDSAVAREGDFSRDVLSRNLDTLTSRADRLAAAISAPIAATGEPTGFEAIASAYENWLSGDGLRQILDLATSHFASTPARGEAGGNLSLLRGQFDRPRASVEIDRVEIVIEEPEAATGAESALDDPALDALTPPMSDEEVWRAWYRHSIELEERVVRPSDTRALAA